MLSVLGGSVAGVRNLALASGSKSDISGVFSGGICFGKTIGEEGAVLSRGEGDGVYLFPPDHPRITCGLAVNRYTTHHIQVISTG